MTVVARPYDEVSISKLSFWAATAEAREASFRILRDERPVSWHPPMEGSLMAPEHDGFWAVTRHEDIVRVSREPKVYSSAYGVMLEEVPEDILDAAQSFLGMDDPRHNRLRRLVSLAFSPRQIARIERQIHAQAADLVDELLEQGECDFVAQVSRRLPMWTIFEMMGVPPDQRDTTARNADGMVSWADEEVAAGREPGEVLADSLVALLATGLELVDQRRARPTDDLMTALVQAEVEGERLTDEEIGAFFVLLSVAGNDTTRNTISLGAKALSDNPDQKQLLLDDFAARIPGAVEEFIRWATPVMTFRRTALEDVELGGRAIAAGEWVVMLYPSGNRDERVFSEPGRFDITRDPNPHVGFGGGGPHFCMGANLARVQLHAVFEQLLHRAPDLELGDPVFLVGNFVRGVKSMPARIR